MRVELLMLYIAFVTLNQPGRPARPGSGVAAHV
jgi:hypothetical protein